MPDNDKPSELPEIIKLDPRERALVSAIMAGQSDSQALRSAGYAESTVRRGAGHFLSRPHIQSAIAAAMADAGITPGLLAARLRDGLDATDTKGTADYYARHKYLETALRVGGHEPGRDDSHEESYEEQILRLRGIGQGSGEE